MVESQSCDSHRGTRAELLARTLLYLPLKLSLPLLAVGASQHSVHLTYLALLSSHALNLLGILHNFLHDVERLLLAATE